MQAYLTDESINTIGQYIFKIEIYGLGGNSKLIGPFTINILEGEIPLVFPSRLINPKEGISEINVQ
jgi:hypothetical protein